MNLTRDVFKTVLLNTALAKRVQNVNVILTLLEVAVLFILLFCMYKNLAMLT